LGVVENGFEGGGGDVVLGAGVVDVVGIKDGTFPILFGAVQGLEDLFGIEVAGIDTFSEESPPGGHLIDGSKNRIQLGDGLARG
jgi:hypothetical protein